MPLVCFLTGDSEQLQTVEQKEFTVELGGKVVARRLQLPLKLVDGRSLGGRRGASASTSRRG